MKNEKNGTRSVPATRRVRCPGRPKSLNTAVQRCAGLLNYLGRKPVGERLIFPDEGRALMPPIKDSKDIFQVYQTGALTVVGFGGREILDQIDLSACRSEILGLVEKHKCQTLAFDLSGVKLIPSGMLGLLASLRKMNIVVHLYNPSQDVAEVLQITRLAEVMPIHYIDVDAQGETA